MTRSARPASAAAATSEPDQDGATAATRKPDQDGAGHQDQIAGLWRQHRRTAFDVAYRLLGSVAEAEDVVQDAYARLLRIDPGGIHDARGWLITVASRLSIDRLRRHDNARRSYVGPWLPEPIVTGAAPTTIEDRVTLDDSVRMALLVVLEQLSPAERTAFVLHEVFSLPFDEIARIVGRSSPACRQLASRARRRIDADPAVTRFAVGADDHARVADRFALACQEGDLAALIDVLAADVTGDFDSGGRIPGAPVTALAGAEPVARQLLRSMAIGGTRFDRAMVNGGWGVVVSIGDGVAAVIALGFDRGRVATIHGIGNPDKLAHLRR
jgi:RNA polymerase sigma-70 factor (ECF subfamily)